MQKLPNKGTPEWREWRLPITTGVAQSDNQENHRKSHGILQGAGFKEPS